MQKLKRHRIMGMDAPVPWFVTWFKDGKAQEYGVGEPDFRVADTRKLNPAIRNKLCWVCGEKLGVHIAFVIGPMCAINRVSSEPPCHLDCAVFSAQACPFLTRPRMRRNEKNVPLHIDPAGIMIERNPGVACVWTTKGYRLFRPGFGDGLLFKIGDPTGVHWFAQGRKATRAEIIESIDSGYPILLEMAQKEGSDAVLELSKQRENALTYVPGQ
jgi:hypothetical protein